MKLEKRPIFFKAAKEYILKNHRHHKPPVGHLFSISACVDGEIVGVAVVGRPVARKIDSSAVVEVTRLCTDGTKNACSFLYAACRRTAKEMGYKEIITYTQDSELGTSLKASGWECLGLAGGKSWNVPSRPRTDKSPCQMKIKYRSILNPC